MVRLPIQGQHLLKFAARTLRLVLYGWLFLGSPSVASAAEADLKVGETIGPQNWQKIQGMVGENLLSRIKAGYTLQIKAAKGLPAPQGVRRSHRKIFWQSRPRSQWRTAQLYCWSTVPKTRPKRPADRPETGMELFLPLAGRRLQNRRRGQRRENSAVCHREGRVGAPRGCGFLLSFSEHALHLEPQAFDPRLRTHRLHPVAG